MTPVVAAERVFHGLVELHASWFVVNPIQGCPKQCGYCFLNAWNQTGTRPVQLADASAAIAALVAHPSFAETIPVCLLTHTDAMATPDNQAMLLALVRHARERGIANPLCFVTKCEVPPDVLDQLAALHSEAQPIVVYVSLSGLDSSIERGVSHHRLRRGLARLAAAPMPVIHYFRPILPANLHESVVRDVFATVAGVARASVLAGLKLYPDLDPERAGWPELRASWSELLSVESIFPDGFEATLARVRREFPDHPIYDSNLCALSATLGRPDLGGFYATPSCLSVSHCPPAQRHRCASFHADAEGASRRLASARAEAAAAGARLTLCHHDGIPQLRLSADGGVVTADATRLRHVTRLPVVIESDARDGYWPSSAAGAHSITWPSHAPWRGCNATPIAARALAVRRDALVLRGQFRAIEAAPWDGLASIAELCVQVGHLTEAIHAPRAPAVARAHEPGRKSFELADELADCLLHATLLGVVLGWDDRMFAARIEAAATTLAGAGDTAERAAVLVVLSAQIQESGLRIRGARAGVDRGAHFGSERAFLDDRLDGLFRGLFALAAGEAIDLFAAFDAMLGDARRFLCSGVAHDHQRSSLLGLRARFVQPIGE